MRKVRSFLSVLLVCCLLVNVVPIKSDASFIGTVAVSYAAADPAVKAIVFSALVGLGVSFANGFDDFYSTLKPDLLNSSFYSSNGLPLYSPGGNWSFGVDLGFLNWLHSWLFDSKTLSYGFNLDVSSFEYSPGHEITLRNGSVFRTESAPYNYLPVRWYDESNMIEYSGDLCWWPVILEKRWNHECYINDNKVSGCKVFYLELDKNTQFCFYLRFDSKLDSSIPFYGSFYPDIGYGVDQLLAKSIASAFISGNSIVNSNSDNVSLESVCPPDQLGSKIDWESSVYSGWIDNSVTVSGESDDSDDLTILPVPFVPDNPDAFSDISQESVWEGNLIENDSEAGTGTETGLLSSILSAVKSIPSAFEGWFTDLIDLAGEIGEAIIGLPARIKDALTSLFQDVVNVGQAVVDAVLGIPQAIADVLTAIFVPDQAYVESKVDAVYAQFPFIQSIIATGEELKGAVSGNSGPPVIYVDLGLAPSGDFGSQKVLLTDFSWYEPHKQRVDTLLSAALWALFGWRMYLRLPSIISGEGGIMIASERAYRKLGDD